MPTAIDLEHIAALLHQGWMQFKQRQGVVFGPTRTPATHPHLVEWSQLDEESRNQDRFIASIVIRDWQRGLLPLCDLPAAIHNAWADWSQLRGEDHPHAVPFYQAHAIDPAEHQYQADLISGYLDANAVVRGSPDDQATCLALLPFRQHTLEVYDQVLEPAIRTAGFLPVRADLLRGSQAIQEDVIDQIERTTVVIADLTDDNPNVNYEIGIARALGRPIIMIAASRRPEDVPFYYKGQRIQFYDRTMSNWNSVLFADVQQSLQHAIRSDPLSENQKLGLTGYFAGDQHSFQEALIREIRRTKKKIVAVGWGLAFLTSQRRDVMKALHDQVMAQGELIVHIILARKDHPGLLARIAEEREHQPATGIFSDWESSFFMYAQELPRGLNGWPRERVHVRRLPYLPTAMIMQLDDVYYVRCYGPPNIGGWESPWLRCQGALASPTWRRFLDNMINEAVAHCVPDPDEP